jgi:uncharacterized protein YciI
MTSESPPTYFVLFHAPGPEWQEGVPAKDQAGIADHVEYFSGFFAPGTLFMGGPFLDNSGGMAIFKSASIEEVRAIALADPAVQTGLLKADVKSWLVPFHP